MNRQYKSSNEKISFILFAIFLIILFTVILSPFILSIDWIKQAVKECLKPLGNNIPAYTSMLGSLLAVSTTVMFTIWQSERKNSREEARRLNKEVDEIFDLLQETIISMRKTIEKIHSYKISKNTSSGIQLKNDISENEGKFRKAVMKIENRKKLTQTISDKYEIIINSMLDYHRKAGDVRFIWIDVNCNHEDDIIINLEKEIDDFQNCINEEIKKLKYSE